MVAALACAIAFVNFDAGLVVLFLAMVGAVGVLLRSMRQGRRWAPQPVAKPVADLPEAVVQPVFEAPQPVLRVHDYRRQASSPVAMVDATAAQPVASVAQPVPQPVANGVAGMVEALGVTGAAQWYQDQAPGSAPWDVADPVSSETTVPAGGDRPLLPRRPPTMTDYPLIAEVLAGSRSQNEAIRVLWGAKDGKTVAWCARVRDLYVQEEHISRADIIAWELELTGDDAVDVALRLVVSVEEVEAVLNG